MNNSDVSSLLPKLKTTLLTSRAVQHTDRSGVYQWKMVVLAGMLHYCTISSCIILWFSPGFRTPLRGLERTIPVSVIPYLSRSLCPVISSHRWNRGDGRGDEPLTISLEKQKMYVLNTAQFVGVIPCLRPSSQYIMVTQKQDRYASFQIHSGKGN